MLSFCSTIDLSYISITKILISPSKSYPYSSWLNISATEPSDFCLMYLCIMERRVYRVGMWKAFCGIQPRTFFLWKKKKIVNPGTTLNILLQCKNLQAYIHGIPESFSAPAFKTSTSGILTWLQELNSESPDHKSAAWITQLLGDSRYFRTKMCSNFFISMKVYYDDDKD